MLSCRWLVLRLQTAMINRVSEPKSASKREGGILIPFSILCDEALTNTEKHVYCYILSFNVNGMDFFSGSDATGLRLGLNPVQVRRAIARLCTLGFLTRVKSMGMSVLRCNKMLQLTDPIDVTNCAEDCNDSLQQATQFVTHNNNTSRSSNNKSNYNISTNHSGIEESTSPLSENSDSITTDNPSKGSPSKKVPEKKVPRPSADSAVLMTDEEWRAFVDMVSLPCALYLCAQFNGYPKKSKYKDHYRTLTSWNQKELAKRKVFAYLPKGGWGYYDQYTKGLTLPGGSDE